MSEWSAYRIRFPNNSDWQSDWQTEEGRVLETVYHVAHAKSACRILEDGYLKAGLVRDESRLNESRIAVTWLSANTWANGSIYGNVQFSFSWANQVANRRFYWVEAMHSYKIPAYRILITDRDLSESKYVKPYDPLTDEGPLREGAGVWYWNGACTSEFLIERDIFLEQCTGFDFITHHS